MNNKEKENFKRIKLQKIRKKEVKMPKKQKKNPKKKKENKQYLKKRHYRNVHIQQMKKFTVS